MTREMFGIVPHLEQNISNTESVFDLQRSLVSMLI